MNTALTRVLGAVAYGEWKAYEGAKADADATDDPGLRRRHKTVAAEELRHHKGFGARLETVPGARARAGRASREMLLHMAWSGRIGAAPLTAFLRVGRPDQLLRTLLGGHVRRMHTVGLAPFGLPVPSARTAGRS